MREVQEWEQLCQAPSWSFMEPGSEHKHVLKPWGPQGINPTFVCPPFCMQFLFSCPMLWCSLAFQILVLPLSPRKPGVTFSTCSNIIWTLIKHSYPDIWESTLLKELLWYACIEREINEASIIPKNISGRMRGRFFMSIFGSFHFSVCRHTFAFVPPGTRKYTMEN